MLRDDKFDLFHCLNCLESIGKIEKYSSKFTTHEEFFGYEDQVVYNACLTLLGNIGEGIKKLSDSTQSRLISVDIPKIIGLRNRIVHDYAGLNSYLVYKIIKSDLNSVKIAIATAVAACLREAVFDIEEYAVAKIGQYYSHIDFRSIDETAS